MFESITLKFTEGERDLIVPGGGVTVFVGPNNSGKSLALNEIGNATANFNNPSVFKIVRDFKLQELSIQEVNDLMDKLSSLSPQNATASGQLTIGRFENQGLTQ